MELEHEDTTAEEPEEILTQEDEDVEEHVDRFFAELDIDQEKQKRRLKTDGSRAPRRRSTLPSHLYQVMGSANLSLARGETSAAIELCLEVIRQAPYVVEPFLTLATVYEDTGEKEKLLQILLISANLKRSDHDLWVKVADLAVELQQLPLAAQCLAKGFKFDSQNLSLLWRKGHIYQELENWKRAMDTYQQLKKLLPSDSDKEHVEVGKELARIYHIQQEDVKAVQVLQETREMYGALFDDKATNILSELLISSRMFSEALETIISLYKIPHKRTTTNTVTMETSVTMETATPITSHREPLTLSAALSLSMNTSEILDPITGAITSRQSSLTGTDREEVIVTELPDTLPVDLRSKLSVCLINLRYQIPESLLFPLTSNPEEYGDLLLDVTDAHMENIEYSKALPILTLLTETDNFNQAGVWLKHAECLNMIQELDQAAISYRKVLSLAPHHTETRMTLASLYSQLGMTEDALLLLDSDDFVLQSHSYDSDRDQSQSSQDEVSNYETQSSVTAAPPLFTSPAQILSQDVRLLYAKFKLLVGENRVSDYIGVAIEMMTLFFRNFFFRNNLKGLFGFGVKVVRHKLKASATMEGTEILKSPEEEKALKKQENYLTVKEWWDVFFKMANGLYQSGNNKQILLRMIMCADVSKKFDSFERTLYLLMYEVCLYLNEINEAFHFIRVLYFKPADSPEKKLNFFFWTLLNKIPPSNRMQKFVLRQLIKNPNQIPLIKMSGNYSMIASSYKFALAQYEIAYKQDPDNYILCLCIAVVYCNLSLQKHSLHRNTLVLQSVSFLHKYHSLRGECQESCYNVARLFHQLGIVHVACQYYKRVLSLETEANPLNKRVELSDLRREAAFNLSLIYKNSHNDNLAMHYIKKYCTI